MVSSYFRGSLSDQTPSLDGSDEILLARVALGEQSALKTLITRHSGPISNFISEVIHDETEAKEILAEVFLCYWEGSTQYTPIESKFIDWLLTVARRICFDRLHRRQNALGLKTDRDPIATANIRPFILSQIDGLPAFQHVEVEPAFFRLNTTGHGGVQTKPQSATISHYRIN